MTRVIAVVNQKGGVGKTTTVRTLADGFAKRGLNVLMIDADSQASLTSSCGFSNRTEFAGTLRDVMKNDADDIDVDFESFFVDVKATEGKLMLLPADIGLASVEQELANAFGRELLLRNEIETIKEKYAFDYIFIDCSPSFSLTTVNAIVAADSVIIPVGANYLAEKGFEQLVKTIVKIRKNLNPSLKIEGILFTMVKANTNEAKITMGEIKEECGQSIKIFGTVIPNSTAAEACARNGISIFDYAPQNPVAKAYRDVVNELAGDFNG